MNLTQKIIFAMLMVLLAGVLVLSHVPVDNLAAKGVAKYALIATIFTASLFAARPTRIHKILGLGIVFLLIGDFFLVLLWNIFSNSPDILFVVKICGMAGFFSGYACLIWVYTRKFSFAAKDILSVIPVLVVLIPVLIIIIPLVSTAMFIFACFFALAVSFMAWSAICTIRRGYYTRKVAIRFALAGYLMFLSDMGVAFIMFYPGMENFPWLENEVWITYIPAWALILVTTYEENLLKEPAN